MDYEKAYKEALAKAKAYDEALELMKDCIPDENGLVHVRPEEIFSEFETSEDERVRKEIEQLIQCMHDADPRKERWLAWLEKQSEHLENYDEAEKEKADFVGDGFIKCYADFQDFKEGETYWLEYIGDDKYNVRSDNLLGKTYHITPCQLYTVFKKMTWLEKQGEQKFEMKSAEESLGISSEEYNDIVNECLYGESNSSDKEEPKFKKD